MTETVNTIGIDCSNCHNIKVFQSLHKYYCLAKSFERLILCGSNVFEDPGYVYFQCDDTGVHLALLFNHEVCTNGMFYHS